VIPLRRKVATQRNIIYPIIGYIHDSKMAAQRMKKV
jgi:hypothetical protein